MVGDGDLPAARDHEERTGTLDAVVGGERLLGADHGRGAEQIVPDQLDHVAADAAGRVPAHYRLGVAGRKKKGG